MNKYLLFISLVYNLSATAQNAFDKKNVAPVQNIATTRGSDGADPFGNQQHFYRHGAAMQQRFNLYPVAPNKLPANFYT